MTRRKGYIPALHFDWLAPAYDPVVMFLMRERFFKHLLIQRADIRSGHTVLDLACGTATLTILIKRSQPSATVIGIDGDERILAIARKKTQRSGCELRLDKGFATALPYPDERFDRVLTSLAMHHLATEDKRIAMKETLRVLRRTGRLHIADFGPPTGVYARVIALLLRRLEPVEDNYRGMLPVMMREAGLVDVAATDRVATVFGTLYLYQGLTSSPT